jgi:hypothetical protein
MNRAQSLLLVRPRPLADEALTSWASRIAWENGYLNTSQLLKAMHTPFSNFMDLDVDPDSCVTEFLSRSTGQSVQTMAFMTRSAAFGDASAGDADSWRHQWYLHRVYRSRRTVTPRSAICIPCLRGGIQHWRRAWRLAWMTRCPVHGCMLKDRCAQCGEPIEVDLLRLRPLCFCGQCGADMTVREQGNEECCDYGADGQSWPGEDWLEQVTQTVPSQVIQVLLGTVMDRWFFHMQARLPGITEAARIGLEALSKNPPTRVPVGRMWVQERHVLFALLGRMLHQYPHNVRETFETAGCVVPAFLACDIGTRG